MIDIWTGQANREEDGWIERQTKEYLSSMGKTEILFMTVND
jgi:hypothetical protein